MDLNNRQAKPCVLFRGKSSLNRQAIYDSIMEDIEHDAASCPVLGDEAEVVRLLRLIGYEITYVEDIADRGLDRQRSIPLLLEWLMKTNEESLIFQILKILGKCKSDVNVLNVLVLAFCRRDIPDEIRWKIGDKVELIA